MKEMLCVIALTTAVTSAILLGRYYAHDNAVNKDMHIVELSIYQQGLIHKANIQKKCGIKDDETMTDAWFKIDACLDKRKEINTVVVQ